MFGWPRAARSSSATSIVAAAHHVLRLVPLEPLATQVVSTVPPLGKGEGQRAAPLARTTVARLGSPHLVDHDEGPERVEDHRVDAFDVGTRVSVMSDGSVLLKVPQMPPSWSSHHAFDGFQAELAAALEVQVTGLDKELFLIRKPAEDTVARLKAFLLERRQRDELR